VSPRNGDWVRIWYGDRWHTGRVRDVCGYSQTGFVDFPRDYVHIPSYPDGSRAMVKTLGEMRPADGADFYSPERLESHRG
jgi:hypothetical protein